MDDSKERYMEKRRLGRPQKVYIKGKEPVQNHLTMSKEEWDYRYVKSQVSPSITC